MSQPSLPTASHRLARSRLLRIAVLFALFTPLLISLSQAAGVAAQEVPELQVNSNRYMVVDSETGEVYAQRNADERVAIGSLTKIFTVIEALEIAPLDTVITTDESDLKDPANNSLMGFQAGEDLTLEELLYGLMLPSGNDAAHAVARGLGYQEGDTDSQQSVDRFMGWINQRVLDMGLVDTYLITPDGWGVPGHYTTAHDLAAFTRYAMTYPLFKTLISTAEYTTAAGNPIYNNNRLLGLYPDLVGGKTGYDWDAGWCLVEVAERDGMQMVSVTLDGVHENMDWYDDNEVLLDYGFDQRTAQERAATAWDGRSALFRDPDIAVLDRSTTATAQLGGDPVALAATNPNASTGQTTGVAAVTDTGGDAVGDTGTTDTAADGIPAVSAQTDDIANQDASGGGTGIMIARIALVVGLTGLVVLAAGLLYTRLGPRRTSPAGALRSAPPQGAATGAARQTAISSSKAPKQASQSAARSVRRRMESTRR